MESKAEIIFKNGLFKEIILSEVKGKKLLDAKNLKNFKVFVEAYRIEIVNKWIEYFVYNKPIQTEVITQRV